MNVRLRTLQIALVLCVCLLAASVHAKSIGQQLTQESAVETIMKRGTLKVGMDTFVPWAMKDKTGKFIGFEIDVATRLAEDMGVKVEFVPTKWSGIIPALLTGKFDVLIGGMSIRADRAIKVNFTNPYYETGMSILANKKLAPGLSTLEAFNNPKFTIVAKTGTSAQKAAQKYLPKADIKLFDSEPQCLQEVLNNRAHAFVSSAPLPAFEAAKNPEKLYLPMQETFTMEPIAFALRKGDPDALAFFNSWIAATRAEGWIEDRRRYWFNTRDWEDQIQ
jgi:polar amino acid transport system substrate-binding protein